MSKWCEAFAWVILIAALLFALFGCASFPEQKVGDGQTGCTTISHVSLAGTTRGSSIVTRTDNVPKGANATASTVIRCGDAVLELTNNVTQPEPRPAPPPNFKP